MNAPQFQAPQQQYQQPQQGYQQPPQQYQQPQQGYQQPAPQQYQPQPQGYQQPQQGYQQPQQQWQPPQQQQQQWQPPQQNGYGAPAVPQQGWAQPGQQQVMGLFRGIENARDLNQSDFITQGKYWCRIDGCKTGISQKDRGAYAAINLTVVHVLDNAGNRGHRLGAPVVRIMKDPRYLLSETRQFIGGSLGVKPEQITEANVNEVFGPRQPLMGTVVEVTAWEIIGRTSGKPFTKVKFDREVHPAELIQTIPPDIRNVFFPGGVLERAAAAPGQLPHALPQQAPQAPYQQPQQQAPQFQQQPQQAPQANGWQPPQTQYTQPGPQQPNHGMAPPPGYPQGAPQQVFRQG